MSDRIIPIRFQDSDYVIIGDRQSGAITKIEDYECMRCSYAHLYADGTVKRFSETIGTREEITFLEPLTDREAAGCDAKAEDSLFNRIFT